MIYRNYFGKIKNNLKKYNTNQSYVEKIPDLNINLWLQKPVWNFPTLPHSSSSSSFTSLGDTPIFSYMGVCHCEGYGFQAVYSGIEISFALE